MSPIRTLSFALLATLSLPALADTSKGLCVPHIECKPLTIQAVKGPLATHVFWFVRSERGTILHQGFSCPNAICDLPAFIETTNKLLTGKMTPTQAKAQVASFTCDYSNFNPIAGEHPICVERKDALMGKMDVWLAGIPVQTPWWRVKANGIYPTRPAYVLANGVRGTKEVKRVAVGEPCNVAKPTLVSGKDAWAEFSADSGVVALCEQVGM